MLQSLKVLIVNDRATAREELQRALRRYSLNITIQAPDTFTECLKELENPERFDLYLLDYELEYFGIDASKYTGLTLARKLDERSIPHISIVIATNFPNDGSFKGAAKEKHIREEPLADIAVWDLVMKAGELDYYLSQTFQAIIERKEGGYL